MHNVARPARARVAVLHREGAGDGPGRAAPVEVQLRHSERGERGERGRGQEDGQRPECPLKEEDGFRHVAPHFEGRRNLKLYI